MYFYLRWSVRVCTLQSIGRGVGDDGNTIDGGVLLEEMMVEAISVMGQLDII